ncbi:hypothetical protein [Haladaptatus pallidirubidus]|uniref:hypothetical protein n=1 Tax=Haladaptatus pallidirubidus TaxID=1008152 RepID=UPI001D1069EE|nr:hypothetical protein [Haladaptatus pallidirubidus]
MQAILFLFARYHGSSEFFPAIKIARRFWDTRNRKRASATHSPAKETVRPYHRFRWDDLSNKRLVKFGLGGQVSGLPALLSSATTGERPTERAGLPRVTDRARAWRRVVACGHHEQFHRAEGVA